MSSEVQAKGEHEEDSPDEDVCDEGDDGSEDTEGMASRLDRILEGPPQADITIPRTGAPKAASSGSRDGQQGESSSRRSRTVTPPAPAQGRAVPRPQPSPASKAGHRAKAMSTGPLTHGRATASSQGEEGRRSSSPGARLTGDAEPRPAPARERPEVSTRGSSRPAGRGTGRRVALPVG